jgi:hypothetical protein
MQLTRRAIVFSILIASLAITSQGWAESEKYCHVLFEQALGKALGCKQGDTLIAQMMSHIAPAVIVARYCDLRFSIFSATHELQPGKNEVTVVCTFIEERQLRK